MEYVRASEILVSGQGVREGIALRLLKMAVAATKDVKEASLVSLVSRFDGWNADAAARRRSVAAALWRALEPQSDPKIAEALDHSARVLDIGRSLDFVARHELVANILLSTELNGFTHEELALVAALVRRAGDRHADTKVFGPLITDRTARSFIARQSCSRSPTKSRRAARTGVRSPSPAVSAAR